jgi:hypothetical protein
MTAHILGPIRLKAMVKLRVSTLKRKSRPRGRPVSLARVPEERLPLNESDLGSKG